MTRPSQLLKRVLAKWHVRNKEQEPCAVRGTRGWSYGHGAGAPSDVLPQPMREHRTTRNPHEKIPPPTRICPRSEKPSVLCHIHALKGSSHDSQARNRDVVTPVGLDGREQPANLQGMMKTRTKNCPACVYSSLASLVQRPGCAMELVLQARILQHLSAPCTRSLPARS